MKLFLLILIIAAFLQTSFVPLNLCLILIIARSLYLSDVNNFFLSFFAGVNMGILTSGNLGIWPLFFLIAVQIIYLFKKLPLSPNFLMVFPQAFVVFGTIAFLEKIILNLSINFFILVVESLLTAAVFLIIRFSQERFMTKKDIKLKFRS